MSSNLLKYRGGLDRSKTHVIDTNDLIAKRLEELSVKTNQGNSGDGFIEGLKPAVVDVNDYVCGDSEDSAKDEGERTSSVMKAMAEQNDQLESKALEEANNILSEASEKARNILTQAEEEKKQILSQAKEEGYQEGLALARRELELERKRLEQREKELEKEYDELIDQLEPQFVDHLTDIYEHIFRVDFSSNRDILEYLISNAMRKIENSRSFLLRVSSEDYPYVSMRKHQILGGASYGDATMEIIEDISLEKNQCRIETENGIFDCSLGTQLAEVSKAKAHRQYLTQ